MLKIRVTFVDGDSESIDDINKIDYQVIRKYLVHMHNKKLSKNVSLLDSIGSDKDGSDITLLDVIPSSERLVEEEYEHNLDLNKLKSYLHVLDERETMIINLRYGLNGNKELTQKEISKLYKISRSYVSRIEKRALVKLLSEFKRNS